jgi:hypothetical protein
LYLGFTEPCPVPHGELDVVDQVMFKRALENSTTATFKELARVIRVLKRMLVATQSEATPSSEEGQRILSFFINR